MKRTSEGNKNLLGFLLQERGDTRGGLFYLRVTLKESKRPPQGITHNNGLGGVSAGPAVAVCRWHWFGGDSAELVVSGLVLGKQDRALVLAHEVPEMLDVKFEAIQ